MSDAENAQRRQFLEPLVKGMEGGWTSRVTIIAPFGALGVELHHPDISGHAAVVPCMATSPGEIHYAFPGAGTPLYQLLLHKADGGIAHSSRHQKPADVIATLNAWLTAARPARFVARPMRPQWLEARSELDRAMQSPIEVRQDFDPAVTHDMSEHAKARLSDALSRLAPQRLARHAPRDEKGRLELKSEILLMQLGAPAQPSTVRFMWLYAAGPDRRRDEQVLTLRIADLIPQNAEHRWEEAPWLWQNGAAPPAFDAAILSAAAGEKSSDPSVAKAMESLAHLDRGDYVQAFGLYGIELSEALVKALMGESLTPVLRNVALAEQWADVLHQRIWETAPWQIASLAERWRAQRLAKSRSKSKLIEGRFSTLPHQTQQRKAGLSLAVTAKRTSLEVTWSATNARVPEIDWKRSVTIDAARFKSREQNGAER